MNETLEAALAQRAVNPNQRGRLRALRHEPVISFRDRVDAAGRLYDAGDFRGAALWYASALRRAGDSRGPAMAYRLGNALRLAGHGRAAAAVLEAVCRAQPEWGEPANSLAWLHRNAGQLREAAAVIERWLASDRPAPNALHAGAGFLADMGFRDRAEALLARIPEPTPAQLTQRATLLLELGHFERAGEMLRRSLERDPTQGEAWLRVAHVRRWERAEASPLAAMESIYGWPGMNDTMRAAVGFALAKVNDDLGRYEQAWQRAMEANALRAHSCVFDRSVWEQFESYIYQVFTKEKLEKVEDAGGDRPSPVFIVGMPRSGTTLLERRLGRHSRLQAAGELEVVESLGISLAGSGGFPHGLLAADDAAFKAAADRWALSIPEGVRPGCEVIDKNPMNFFHLGLICRLFPRARIIHCRRDPLDTALSLWFQDFAHPRNYYAYRIEDLAWMYGFYRRVMAWWERVLPMEVATVDYEALVASPEPTLRGIVEALGLDWEPAVLEAPAGGEGSISTASVWQARQPLYRHAAGRARHYEPWIEPLRAALYREISK